MTTGLQRIWPAPAGPVETDDVYRDAPIGVRANMIASLDGAAWFDGTVRPISNPADLRLLVSLRAFADVVLVGAGTARAENYGPVRLTSAQQANRMTTGFRYPIPPIAIVTASGKLATDTRLFMPGAPRPIIITTEEAARKCASLPADVVTAGSGTVRVERAVQVLAERGCRKILCEGGPTLLEELTVADLVEEMCFTLAPKLAGRTPETRRVPVGGPLAAPVDFGLRHVLSDGAYLFTRYVRNRSSARTTVGQGPGVGTWDPAG